MKNFPIAAAAIAVSAALVLGVAATADARDRGARKGVEKHAQQRAGHREFQRSVDRRQARQRGRIRHGARSGRLSPGQVARLRNKQKHIGLMERHFRADGRYNRQERHILNHALHGSSKRIWRMKGKRYGRRGAHRPKYRVKRDFRKRGHYRDHRRGHHGHRVEYVYPVYDESPAESLGLDIETKDFRFSVNKSG